MPAIVLVVKDLGKGQSERFGHRARSFWVTVMADAGMTTLEGEPGPSCSVARCSSSMLSSEASSWRNGGWGEFVGIRGGLTLPE
jgi:hypothetical protein